MYMSLQNDDSKISSPVGVSHRGVNSIEEAFQIRHFEGHSPRNDFEGFSKSLPRQALFTNTGSLN